MRQFVYISTAKAGIGEGDVDEMVQSALRNNRQFDITGFLVFNGQNFLQLIEGPGEALRGLMAMLYADPRHEGIVQLAALEIEERSCADWVMQRIRLSDDKAGRGELLAGMLPPALDPAVRSIIMNFAVLN